MIPYMNFSTLAFYSPHIVKLSLQLMKRADQLLGKTFNLTHSQFMIMMVLHQCGSRSQVQLASTLNLTGAAISRLVNTLTGKGFLTRTEDPDNRRQNTLQLTKEGENIIAGAIEKLLVMEKKLYGQLHQEKLSCFIEVCDQLSEHLLKGENNSSTPATTNHSS